MKTTINSKLALIFLTTLSLGAIYLVIDSYNLTKIEIDISNQEEAVASAKMLRNINQEDVLYMVNEGNGKIISSKLIATDGSSVFSLLEELSEKENFKIESKTYKDMGVLVESIDGIDNGTDNKYWQYWVNGKLPMVSADKKEVKNGDRIEWKFDLADF